MIITLLEGFKSSGPSTIDAAKAAEQYGISKDDLKVAGVNAVQEISTGLIYLLPEKGNVDITGKTGKVIIEIHYQYEGG